MFLELEVVEESLPFCKSNGFQKFLLRLMSIILNILLELLKFKCLKELLVILTKIILFRLS